MFNRVFLIGRLTRDPEMRYTSTGVALARFTIAVNRPQRSGGNDETDFIRVAAWRKLAEICGEYLKKGKLISIEGRLQISKYEKNGKTLSSAEVIADSMQMLDRKEMGTTPAAEPVAVAQAASSDESVPF